MKTFQILFFLFFTSSVFAQNYHYGTPTCGTVDSIFTNIPEEEKNFCFDVDSIYNSCTKIWIRVNIHFFLDDLCKGNLDPLGTEIIEAEDAYIRAEDLIVRANDALENNYEQWNQDPMWGINQITLAQCVPFRYALAGVYIHCDSQAQGTSGYNINYFRNNFGVNISTEYNGFVVEAPGGASGVANGQPGNALTVENLAHGNYNHEMGHVLALRHSWGLDGLQDTPPIKFQYDYNCDGDFLDSYPQGVGFESQTDRQCWIYLDPTAGPHSVDYDGNGQIDYQDFCDIAEDPNCAPYPCCDWDFINNNIMAYSSYTECCAAYTHDQLIRILGNLSTVDYCPYIEEITTDCPPPNGQYRCFTI